MSTNFDSISADAMSLPPDLRFVLAQQLWESVEGQTLEDAALIAEFESRCAAVDSGEAESIPFEQAMQEIRAKLNES
jgi:putative addiction module component (TIGR02574 family)